jgi:hypothetical protein
MENGEGGPTGGPWPVTTWHARERGTGGMHGVDAVEVGVTGSYRHVGRGAGG